MKRQGIAEALREGIAEEMARDPRVFCIGEDIGVPGGWGGAFTVTLGLAEKVPDRASEQSSDLRRRKELRPRPGHGVRGA